MHEQDWTSDDASEPSLLFSEPYDLLPGDTLVGKLAACFAEYFLGVHGEDPQALSQGLGSAGTRFSKHGHDSLAETMWRASLAMDPTNERTASTLGRRLYRNGNFKEAVDLLAIAEPMDSRARLFRGLARMEVADADDDPTQFSDGLFGACEALKQWAYDNANKTDRNRWLRVSRKIMIRFGFREEVSGAMREVVIFANRKSSWPPMDFVPDLERFREGAAVQTDELTQDEPE